MFPTRNHASKHRYWWSSVTRSNHWHHRGGCGYIRNSVFTSLVEVGRVAWPAPSNPLHSRQYVSLKPVCIAALRIKLTKHHMRRYIDLEEAFTHLPHFLVTTDPSLDAHSGRRRRTITAAPTLLLCAVRAGNGTWDGPIMDSCCRAACRLEQLLESAFWCSQLHCLWPYSSVIPLRLSQSISFQSTHNSLCFPIQQTALCCRHRTHCFRTMRLLSNVAVMA
jgi:hypothetical protein